MSIDPIVTIEDDGDVIEISRIGCMCGSCEDLRIKVTRSDGEVSELDTYSGLDDGNLGGVVLLLAEYASMVQPMRERIADLEERAWMYDELSYHEILDKFKLSRTAHIVTHSCADYSASDLDVIGIRAVIAADRKLRGVK